MALKTSADLSVEINDLFDTNEAILANAEKEERELHSDEIETINQNKQSIEELSKVKAERVAIETHKREIAAHRVSQQQIPNTPINSLPGRGAADRLNLQHRLGPLKAFPNTQEGLRDAYDSGMFLRAVVARGNRKIDEEAEAQIAKRNWSVSNIATEGVPSAGGYLVPAPLSNAIIDVRALAGISRQVSRVVAMTSETLSIAKKVSGTTVYYPGEAGTITASDQVWAQILLTAKKRAILSKISQELRDDAIISVVDDLASQMGTDLAVKEDAEFINGDGTGTYGGVTGLLAALGTEGISTPANGAGFSVWSGLTITQFTNAMALLPDKYWQYSPSWICSAGFYFATMLRVQAAAGGNQIQSLEQGASAGRPMFLGYPVYFTNQMALASAVSTVSCLFGAFNQAVIIGDRLGIQIAQSEHLGFAEDVLAVRATTRYDINVHDSGSATTGDVGAYIGLKTAAS